jgi:hypothetical protein
MHHARSWREAVEVKGRRVSAIRAVGVAVWPVLVLVTGCATQSASIIPAESSRPSLRVVRIQPCQDRTGYTGRDLGAEATRALVERVRASGIFEVREDEAPLALTCDVERFEEGSAVMRWLWPTLGPTHGQVAVSVWEHPGDRVLATFRGLASVRGGGLYTLGADRYILGVALDDVVTQMKAWAAGPASAPSR